MALRRNTPARNAYEGVVQYRNKERKIENNSGSAFSSAARARSLGFMPSRDFTPMTKHGTFTESRKSRKSHFIYENKGIL